MIKINPTHRQGCDKILEQERSQLFDKSITNLACDLLKTIKVKNNEK